MLRRSFIKGLAALFAVPFAGLKLKPREPKVCEFKPVPGVNPNDWKDPRNWTSVGGGVPQAGDTVVLAMMDVYDDPRNWRANVGESIPDGPTSQLSITL